MGVKPMYWARTQDGLAFASEVKSLIAGGLIQAQLDPLAAELFLAHGFVPGPAHAVRGRDKLPPASVLAWRTAAWSTNQLYNFATARPAGIKAQTIVVAEGYMDVIALVRAGFDYAVAPLGTALTEDQLQLLWRTAPEPVLAFDGDNAGLRGAARRAARAAASEGRLSLRFAFLPSGDDPDTFIRSNGPAAMRKVLDEALPLSQVLWRVETEDKDFSTPERRAGLERALAEIVSAIGDSKIADYYRRDFEQRVYDAFKRRPAPQQREWRGPDRFAGRGGRDQNRSFRPGVSETVSPAVKASMLARSGRNGAQRVKEAEIAMLLWSEPEIAARHGELLAELPFTDRELDRLRHLLLNVAASGSRLEKPGLENHLVHQGMTDLLARLKARAGGDPADPVPGDADDFDARFLKRPAIFAKWQNVPLNAHVPWSVSRRWHGGKLARGRKAAGNPSQ